MTTFDRIITGIQARNGRYYLTITYENSETKEQSHELSKRWFYSESDATEAATALAFQLQAKVKGQQQ